MKKILISFMLLLLLFGQASALGVIYDDFNGPSIDESKWDTWDIKGALLQEGGLLKIVAPPFYTYGHLYTKPKLSGDFDVITDWKNWDYQGDIITIENDPRLSLHVIIPGGNWISILRGIGESGGYYGTGGEINGDWLGSGEPTSDTSGKFRIARSGSEVVVYYWDNGWQELLSAANFGLDNVIIQLGCYTGDNPNAIFDAAFDMIEILGTILEPCECDFEPGESDGDVDGSDLATYAEGGTGKSLADFAAEFGRTNCP